MADRPKKATREAYGETLRALGAERDDIVVLDADLSASTMTAVFGKAYPGRFFNAGIAEQNLMSVSAGLAASGKTVFASTFAVFATGRAYDQIRLGIAHNRMNVKIVASHSGVTAGEDGASHQAIEDIALMRVLPNMTVLVPADAIETAGAVRAAATTPGPFYIRLGRSPVPIIFDEKYKFHIGRAITVREGKDVAIFATGYMVSISLEAAGILAGKGIAARVINVSTIKPADVASISAAAKECGCAVTAEEHSIIGGLGSLVAEVLAEHCPIPMKRVGIRDTFAESGTPDDLLRKYGLTADDVVLAALEVIDRRG
jgi:transketolase